MAEGERDSTQDWLLPAGGPPTVVQLEQRIDHALAVARASEAAALEIGAAALDAAQQARRAAELAELASGGGATAPAPLSDGAIEVGGEETAGSELEPAFDSFTNFLERAEHVSARLEAIARV